jgi:para-nitrobenzyl esterase
METVMRIFGIGIAVALSFAGQAALAPAEAASTPVVQTTNGPIQGFALFGLNYFLGVPYAAPPVGALRWKPPAAPTPWKTTLQTVAFGNFCPQGLSELSPGGGNEDCLYLNVQTPSGITGASKLPVMVWIHGGGLTTGSGQEYNAESLIYTGNVVTVTFNYRLGVLGFLADPALAAEDKHGSSGNYGTLDQQAVLAWVRANIANFGGDPTKITIFGESAGGQSVITQLVSPLATKLHGAIIESGAYSRSYPTQAQAQTAGATFAASVGCTGSNKQVAACLRSISAVDLVTDQDNANFPVDISPNIDNWVLTQQPFQAVAAGNFQHVPVIDGTNHDEYRLFVSEYDLMNSLNGDPGGYTSAGYVAFVQAEAGNNTPEVLAEYPLSNYASPNYAVSAVATDYAFSCGALLLDALLSNYVPVYAYEFNDPNPPNVLLPPDPYMTINDSHAIELDYLFPLFKNFTLNIGPAVFTAGQSQLSAGMQAAWTSLARYGRPLNPRGGAWQPYVLANRNFNSLISPSQQAYTGFFADHKCDFWGPTLLGEAGLPGNTQY